MLIGGGAGIVRLAAIAHEVLIDKPQARITLIHGARNRARAIFANRLADLARAFAPRLTLALVLEETEEATTAPHGLLSADVLDRVLPADLPAVDRVLICGPAAMEDAVRAALTARGMDAARIRSEAFTSPRQTDATWQDEEATFVAADGTRRGIPVRAGQTLLDATLDGGEAIAFSCLSGGCGACRVQILEGLGNAVLDARNGVPATDAAAGRLPACITRLTGPVTVRAGAG